MIIKEFWETLKPFRTVEDIPDVPQVEDKKEYQEVIVKNLIRCGAIPKKDLINGATYRGTCRNSSVATWVNGKFIYVRYKMGTSFEDNVLHFEDDNIYDVFIPLERI